VLFQALGLGAALGLGSCISLDPPIHSEPAPWDDLHFLHVGGLYLTADRGAVQGRSLEESYRIAMRALHKINSFKRLDFVAFSGDMIANLRLSDARLLWDFTRQIEAPWFAVPGTREASRPKGGLSTADFLSIIEGHGPPRPGGAAAFKVGRRAWVVALDTAGCDEAGGRSPSQLDFLKAHVDAHPQEFLAVLLHHCPYPPQDEALGEEMRKSLCMEDAEELGFVLEAGENIKMVFSGNGPWNEIRTVSGLHLANTPPASFYPSGIREVRVRGNEAELTYHTLLTPDEAALRRKGIAASKAAASYNPKMPDTYASLLMGTAKDRQALLRLR
jgi:hypothetical protein